MTESIANPHALCQTKAKTPHKRTDGGAKSNRWNMRRISRTFLVASFVSQAQHWLLQGIASRLLCLRCVMIAALYYATPDGATQGKGWR